MKLHQRGYMVALRELVDSGRYDTRYIQFSSLQKSSNHVRSTYKNVSTVRLRVRFPSVITTIFGQVVSQKYKTHRRQFKLSSSKKMKCKETLRQLFICLRPRTPYPPPLTHCKGGGGVWRLSFYAKLKAVNHRLLIGLHSRKDSMIQFPSCATIPLEMCSVRRKHPLIHVVLKCYFKYVNCIVQG